MIKYSLLLVVGFVLVALAAHSSWDDRFNTGRFGRLCKGGKGEGSWVEREAYRRCATCHSRCYSTKFNATAESSGGPSGLCDKYGDECIVELFIKTAPCCQCFAGHGEVETFEDEMFETLEVKDTFSRCEVTFFGVLINGFDTLPLDSSCNVTAEPLFTQQWVLNDCTVNKIFDCFDGSWKSGSLLRQAYNKEYRNGRYPDPCFADRHWVDSFASEEKGVVTSEFVMFRPDTTTKWFDRSLTRDDAPVQINCKNVPTNTPVYVEPV